MAYLRTGPYKIDGNGSRGELVIQAVDSDGHVSGTAYQQAIHGWWSESARRLSFLRVIDQNDPTSYQAFTAYAWDEPSGSDRDYYLAGSFETFAGGGGAADRQTYGWFATMHVVG